MNFNFANLTKPGVIPAVAERFRMKGKRKSCSTGVESAVRCVAELRDRENGEKALYIVEGGVTGYESFIVDRDQLDDIATGWYACAGTQDRWDTLYFDVENMTALVAWIRGKL